MKKQLTLKDIAHHFNLSVSTVSRALRDDPTIGKETREKIKHYAKSHHYKPNGMAAGLRTKKSNVIGVIIPEINNFFFASVLDGIEKVAEENNYTIIISQSNEEYEKEVKSVHSLLSTRVAGILVSLAKKTRNYSHFEEIIGNHVPLVFFDRICPGVLTDKVVVNDYEGAKEAVNHLIKTGCKRIAYFDSDPHLEISKNRRNGYLDALRENQIEVDQSLIYKCDTWEEARNITPEILNQENKPDAFLAFNDITASGILFAVKKAGLRIPEDISICGFADGYVSQNTDPTLTSVDQHGYEMGKMAMELILKRIRAEKEVKGISNRIIKTTLIERESTKPVLKQGA
ncbi:MAG: LacI family DNA-binding transcriptional regulator [Bacteroidales bacterium]